VQDDPGLVVVGTRPLARESPADLVTRSRWRLRRFEELGEDRGGPFGGGGQPVEVVAVTVVWAA
jgi:hypothetical protein